MLNDSTVILQVILISIVLFIIINYFISTTQESKFIDDVVKLKKEDDTIDASLELIKSKYLKSKFKTYIIRSLFFGAGLWCVLVYLNPPITNTGLLNNTSNIPNQPINPDIQVKPFIITRDKQFFEVPNW